MFSIQEATDKKKKNSAAFSNKIAFALPGYPAFEENMNYFFCIWRKTHKSCIAMAWAKNLPQVLGNVLNYS